MRRILLVCAIVIALVLAACAAEVAPTPTPDPAPEPTPDPAPDPAPASFTISDLTVYPAEIYAGERITISVLVTNLGDLGGDYRIAFKIRNITVETVDIHLEGGDTKEVDIAMAVDHGPGAYSVDVNGLIGTLTVKDPPASLHLSELTINSAAFTVAIYDDELSPGHIEYSISGQDYGRAEVLPDQPGSVIIDDLAQDTAYSLEISRVGSEIVIDSIVFRTFKEIDDGLQLYYLIDVTAPHDHVLSVQVFGNMRGVSQVSFENRGYHFRVINIVEHSLEVDAGNYQADEDNRKVTIHSDSEQPYFQISYQVDKSIIGRFVAPRRHVYYGFLNRHYLMTTGEVLMLLPPSYMRDSNEWWIYEHDTFEVYGYLKVPRHWESLIGFQVEDDLIDFLSHLPEGKGLGIRAANIYAYDRYAFKRETRIVDGTNINVILQDTIADKCFEDIFAVYCRLSEIWGGGVGDDNYVVMIVDDAHRVYGGEWTTGQGFSASYVYGEILGELLLHQMYHRWNGWKLGIVFSDDQGFIDNAGDWIRGFWSEGFNNFYADKVVTELGFMDHDRMKQFYNWYRTIRGTPLDVPILEFRRGIDDVWIVYWKGALLAYLLDQEIRTQSENTYSLDDVLKYEWERWSVGGHKSSYPIIIDFIRDDLGVHTIDAWWQKYVVDNEPMYREDFSFLAP